MYTKAARDEGTVTDDAMVAHFPGKAEPPSWATTATGGNAEEDVELGELEVASDTDEPKLKVQHRQQKAVRRKVKLELSEASASEHFAKKLTERVSQKPVIALVINGSRGDVQPFVALAQEFRRRGLRAVLFTNSDFLSFCKSAGIEAVSTFPAWTDLIDTMQGLSCPDFPGGQKCIAAEDILSWIEGTLVDTQSKQAAEDWRERHPGKITDLYEALCQYEPAMVLYSLQSQVGAMRYELVHKVPAVPVYFTTAFGPHFTRSRNPRPSLFATSAALDVRVEDSGFNHVTGPWLLQEEIRSQEIQSVPSLAAVKRFVEAGEKPVVIGWGSMLPQGTPAIFMLGLALRALRIAGRRGIILGGWAGLHDLGNELLNGGLEEIGPDHDALRQYSQDKVCFVKHAPHSWLYPLCRCIVNHGGSGTIHAALRSGCPVVVTPIYGDQFHFAQRVSKYRVGCGFLKSLKYIEPKELARAINKAAASGEQAKEVATKMKKDGGASLAVDILQRFLSDQVLTGRFHENASPHKQKRTG